jgi:hypothetical protein
MDTRRTDGPYAGDMSTGSRRPQDPAAALDFGDPLSLPAPEETDSGWGEPGASGVSSAGGGRGGDGVGDDAADLARFLEEKPPHHL